MPDILIVDDEEPIRRLLGRMLSRGGYRHMEAENTQAARHLLRRNEFDLILCDVMMPGENGIDFIRDVTSDHRHTAVVMLTAVDDPKVAEAAMDIGAYGYMIKPFRTNEVLIQIRNCLRRRELEIQHENNRMELEKKVAERTASLQKAMEATVQAMALAVETRDPYTAGHQQRVTDLACRIAQELGISEFEIEGIRMAGRIHDLGKISTPAEILNKPGKLTETEFTLIKNHPSVGYEILKGIEFPWPVADIILQHHERMDGSGYPHGLSGEAIMPQARILSVADVVEAIASHRPYRPALGVERALAEISAARGRLYDPAAVDACLTLFNIKNYKLIDSNDHSFI